MATNIESRSNFVRLVSASVVERSTVLSSLSDIEKDTAYEALNAVLLRIDNAVAGRYRSYRSVDDIYKQVVAFEAEARNEFFRNETYSDLPRELRNYFQNFVAPRNLTNTVRRSLQQGVQMLRENTMTSAQLNALTRRSQQSRPGPLEPKQGEEFHTNPVAPPSTQRTSLNRREIIEGETSPDQKI